MKGKKGFQKGHPNYSGYRIPKGNIPWNKKRIDRDWLYGKYVAEKLSAKKIAVLSRCSTNTILNWLKVFGIKTRNLSEAHKGNKFSIEHRESIGRSQIGKKHPHTEETKIKIGLAGLGRIPTIATRKKISESHRGEKAYQWKGGITPENKTIRGSIEYRIWREKVFKRDKYTDQKTKIRGGILHPHHIKNFAEFPELRFRVSNGITFSEESHNKFHEIYGREHNNKGQVEEFIKKESKHGLQNN